MTADRETLARALHKDGAWCGGCEFDGYDTCDDCRKVCLAYADTALRVTGGAP